MRADNIRRASMWAKALLLRPERRFWLIVGLIALGGGALRVLDARLRSALVHSIARDHDLARDSRGAGPAAPQMFSSQSPAIHP